MEGETLCHVDYRYHCQDADADAALIFRYDSTPHIRELPGFPYHKWTNRGRTTVFAPRPGPAPVGQSPPSLRPPPGVGPFRSERGALQEGP